MANHLKLLTPTQGACIGTTIGFAKACVLQPLFINQIRLQNGHSIIFDPLILYSDFQYMLMNTLAISFVQITVSVIANRMLSSGLVGAKDEAIKKMMHRFASTVFGGALSAVVSTPLEVMMTLKQEEENKGKSITLLLIAFLKKNGVKKLFTGLFCDFIGDALCLCGYFALYPVLHLWMKNIGLKEPFATFFSVAMSTLISALLYHPVDIIKTNQQKLSMGRIPSVIETFRMIWQKNKKEELFLKKLLVFYTGFASRMVFATTSYSISGPLAEYMEYMYTLRGGATNQLEKNLALKDKQNFPKMGKHSFFTLPISKEPHVKDALSNLNSF